MADESHSALRRYSFAVLCVAGALALRLAVGPVLGYRLPFITFFAAVAGAAWYGGLRPSLLALTLSALAADWFFIEPGHALVVPKTEDQVGLAAFAAMGMVIALLGEALHRSRSRAESFAGESRARQAELQVTLRSIGDAVLATDTAGRVVFMNPVAEALTGWTEAEARGKPLPEIFVIVDEGTRLTAEDPAARALREGRPVGLANHTILISRSGVEHPIDDSAAPIRGEGGEVLGVVLVFRDIAERKRAAQSQSALAAIVESSGDAIIGKTLDGRITSWNHGAERLYGYQAAEVLGKPVALLIPPGEPDLYQATVTRLKLGGPTEQYETTRVRKDGERIEVSVTVSPIQAGAGTLVGASIIARDVTDRKRAERALRDSQERLRLALSGGSMGTWTRELDASNRVEWSPELEAIYGLEPGEFSGSEEEFFQFIHPEDRERVGRAVLEAIEKRSDYEVEFRFSPKGGGLHWMIGRGRAIYDAEGRPVRIGGVGVDITARKLAEQALRFLADASTALSALGDPKVTLGEVARQAVGFFADACLVDLVSENGPIERIVSVHSDPAKEALLERIQERFPLSWEDPSGSVRVLGSGRSRIIPDVSLAQMRRLARDPEHLKMIRELNPRSVICVPMVTRERVVGALSFGITESSRRFSAAEVAMAEDLARRAATALENARLYGEAREADRRQDEFLAMLSHELRNPLAPIRNALQLLGLRRGDPEVLDRAHAMMERQVDQLVRLVDDLLDVSRITQGKIRLQKERLELAPVVAHAVESCQSLIEARGHRIRVSLPEAPIVLDADPARLEQVLTNLLNNAAKYTEEGGSIELVAQVEAESVVLRIRDTGIGIAPEILPRVFDLFAQATPTLARSQGGLGIGLTLVRRLVEMHGGRVEAHSEGVGRGSEFVVFLPLGTESPVVEAAVPSAAGSAPGRRPRRVLVVDDNADSAESLILLTGMWGHETRLAHDGPGAVALASEFKPEIVLLDIGLPGMTGYDVARHLRAIPGLEGAFLVAMTGYGQEEDRRRSTAAGIDLHLVKPVDPAMLRKLLEAPA
jgi:PAS domain S-box-containing protein